MSKEIKKLIVALDFFQEGVFYKVGDDVSDLANVIQLEELGFVEEEKSVKQDKSTQTKKVNSTKSKKDSYKKPEPEAQNLDYDGDDKNQQEIEANNEDSQSN